MPIYEYECTNCHQQFDLMQKLHDAPATQCPQCFKDTAIRLVSAAGFQLKGSGWYATDFKNPKSDSKKKETASDASTANKSAEPAKKVESSSKTEK